MDTKLFNNEELIFKNENGLKYIQFKRLLEYNIKHCYTLKSDNIDFLEEASQREESFKILSKTLDIDFKSLVRSNQTHTTNVKCIDKVLNIEELQNVDGLITDKKDIALISRNADCILMIFYDPVKKVIANVHSGWRGTFQKICEKAALKMINYYGSNPKDILCFICPSIRKCHFEVDEDVKILCENIFHFLKPEKFIEKGKMENNKQKYFIDTVLINKLLLEDLGIKEENIIDSNLCSVCNSVFIPSYRIDKENCKRAVALIML